MAARRRGSSPGALPKDWPIPFPRLPSRTPRIGPRVSDWDIPPLAFPHWLSDNGASGAGRDRTVLRCVFLAVSAMVLVACATITRGTTQVVAVDTPGAPGTSCIIQTQNGPQVVTTPGSVTLSRGSSSLPIQCTKECYLLGSSIIPSNAESMAAGNVIFGGIIGLGVDCRLRCDEQIPDVVTVAMTPDPACRTPEPLPPNRAPPRHISAR